MTKFTNNKPKPSDDLTNQDVITYLLGQGFTVKQVLVENNEVQNLEVIENLNAAQITTVKAKYPELI